MGDEHDVDGRDGMISTGSVDRRIGLHAPVAPVAPVAPSAGSACGRVAVQGVIMRGCPLAPVRGPSQLAPRCENLHRTGLAERLGAAILSDLGRHRTRFPIRDALS